MDFTRFFNLLQNSTASGTFLKCTLSKPSDTAPESLKNVFFRPVMIKGAAKLSATYRYKTRDEVKNYTPEEAGQLIQDWLGKQFMNADLFTTEQDATLTFDKKGMPHVILKKASFTAPANTGHNREKTRLLDPASPWLHLLGITNARGEVLPTAQDKWRQINKFLEIVGPLLRQVPDFPADAHIADMGSGKGYLTFALYEFLQKQMDMQPRITGIELRPDLVIFCNKTAKSVGFEHLQFVAVNIEQYDPPRLDLLIALHACDTATDLAIARGIHSAAKAVIVAPCCHKQIRKEMDTHNELAPVLKHGILEERQAEIVTDGIRALLLEANGYKSNVFEFISTDHTAKNLMITALKVARSDGEQKRKKEALAKVDALKTGFGIKQHYLETLLTEGD